MPLFKKRCPDDVPRQIFHCPFFLLLDKVPAEDVESGMPPHFEHEEYLEGLAALVRETGMAVTNCS
jgi:hypothetical protein